MAPSSVPPPAGGTMDPTTGFVNDAFLNETLGPGSYILALTQFPNGAINNFSDGFLFGGQGNFTPGLCGGTDGSFLESDIAPCSQRTGDLQPQHHHQPNPRARHVDPHAPRRRSLRCLRPTPVRITAFKLSSQTVTSTNSLENRNVEKRYS